ncbi:hypothetical protein GCM10027589_12420 [Actinocorallia lasiicapitis]
MRSTTRFVPDLPRFCLAAALLLTLGGLVGCGGDDTSSPDEKALDRFLGDYVEDLNARDEPALAELLKHHPDGAADAKARIAAYGGQGWQVTWSYRSEFADTYQVTGTGTQASGKNLDLAETAGWENGHWHLAPLPGVVPRPSDAATSTKP